MIKTVSVAVLMDNSSYSCPETGCVLRANAGDVITMDADHFRLALKYNADGKARFEIAEGCDHDKG